MTPDQIKLVQQSFAKVAPISEQASVIFYDRLFEVAVAQVGLRFGVQLRRGPALGFVVVALELGAGAQQPPEQKHQDYG